MADPGRYEESAKGLQKKLGTKEAIQQGFRRLSRAEVEKIVSQAGDPDIGKAPERKDLEAALLKKGVRAYAHLQPRGKGHYLLFQPNSVVAQLVDVITGGKDSDKKLADAAKRVTRGPKGWTG